MIFRDFAHYYLVEWFTALHTAKPDLTWREYLAGFTDAVTTAATDLSGKALLAVPGLGVEVDVSADYDPAAGILHADVHLRMVGPIPYTASVVFLQHGFQYLVDDGTYHTVLRSPMAALKELR